MSRHFELGSSRSRKRRVLLNLFSIMLIFPRSVRRGAAAFLLGLPVWLSAAGLGAAPERAESAGSPLALSHVAVKATRYEASVAFYRDFLGFAEQGRLFYPDDGRTELVYFKINDQQWIEVFDAAHVTHRTGAIYQVAFQTADAEALRQRLAREGWPVPATVPRGQMKNANFTTLAPDGTVVEFVQYLPEGRTLRDRGRFLPSGRLGTHLLAVGLPTSRLPDALRLFRDSLGLESRPAAGGTVSGSAVSLRVCGSEDRLELNAAESFTPYFCLAVADVTVAEAALERSRRRCGYHGTLDLGHDSWGRRTLTVTDPDGIRVILVQVP